MNEDNLNLQQPAAALPLVPRRRKLLPWWILVFIWMFLLFAALIPVIVVFGALGYHFNMELLGLKTQYPFSIAGLAILLLFIFKGVTAFALWTEKDWAISIARIDAIISIAICGLTMAYSLFWPGSHTLNLRLELVVLIPYLYKMNQIEYSWLYFNDQEEQAA